MHRRLQTSFLVVSAIFAFACGGSSPPDAAAPGAAGSTKGGAGAPAAAEKLRGPSDEIAKPWPFDDAATFTLYADVDGLLHTQLFEGLMTGVLELAKGSITDVQRECVRAVQSGGKELAVGSDDRGRVVMMRYEAAATKAPMAACAQAFGEAQSTKLEGAPAGVEAYAIADGVVALTSTLLVTGPKELVTSVVAGHGGGRWPSAVGLAKDRYLSWRMKDPSGFSGSGSMLVSNDRFRLDVDADLPSEELAAVIAAQADKKQLAANLPVQGKEAEVIGHLADALVVKRDGKHLAAVFELREPPIDQARDLGTLAALSIFAVKRYMTNAKVAEARAVVKAIARSYVAWWETEGKDKPKAIVSFAPVPKTIPKGTKYVSKPDDWKGWQKLHFEMTEPQRFQYEVRAAKDGKSGEVIARGDLNGDGKPSLFRLPFKVDPATKQLAMATAIEETDPAE